MGGLLGRGCWRGLCWAGSKDFQEAAGEEVLGGKGNGSGGDWDTGDFCRRDWDMDKETS